MKRHSRRESRRLRGERRLEAVNEYIVLTVQIRMLYQLDAATQKLMSEAVVIVGQQSLGLVAEHLRSLKAILSFYDGVNRTPIYSFKSHWQYIVSQPYIHTFADYASQDKSRDASHSVRPQTKIPGQAARFQNYRR